MTSAKDFARSRGYLYWQSPSLLALMCRTLGKQHPDLLCEFSALDIGCGDGFTSIVSAKLFPHARFIGIDRSSLSCSAGAELARLFGVENFAFINQDVRDFREVIERHGRFDFLFSLGLLSWMSRRSGFELLDALGRAATDGGIICLSYNASPGAYRAKPVVDWLRRFVLHARGSMKDGLAVLEEAARRSSDPREQALLRRFSSMPLIEALDEVLCEEWCPWDPETVRVALGKHGLERVGQFPWDFADGESAGGHYEAEAVLRELRATRSFRIDVFIKVGSGHLSGAGSDIPLKLHGTEDRLARALASVAGYESEKADLVAHLRSGRTLHDLLGKDPAALVATRNLLCLLITTNVLSSPSFSPPEGSAALCRTTLREVTRRLPGGRELQYDISETGVPVLA